MVTLISTPAYVEQVSPEILCRWVATESPNNFRLHRHDFDIVSVANNGGYLQITVGVGLFTGAEDDIIAVYNKSLDAMYSGTVETGSTDTIIETDIPFMAGFDPRTRRLTRTGP